MGNYNLLLYTSKTAGKSPVANITTIATNWERTVRLQGGFWDGSFTVVGGIDRLSKWYYNYLNYHIEERTPNITWEGYIDSMELDDSDDPAILDVHVSGYIFKAADRYVPYTVQSSRETTLSNWFVTLVEQCDTDYLKPGTIAQNSMEVKKVSEPAKTIGAELATLTEMGDEDLNFYRYYCTIGGRLCYELMDLTPRYYLYSGMIRKRSLQDMSNYVMGDFSDMQSQNYRVYPQQETGSINQFGRKELKLTEGNLPYDLALLWVQKTLREKAWPWSKPQSLDRNVSMFNSNGEDITYNRWSLKPGVIRDMTGLVSSSANKSTANPYLSDRRDIFINQIQIKTNGIVIDDVDLSNADMLRAAWEWRRREFKRIPRRQIGYELSLELSMQPYFQRLGSLRIGWSQDVGKAVKKRFHIA